jgi:YfiH family protein
MKAPADWIIPQWPAPVGVSALCTTRHGGVSRGPYTSLNLGDHVGDDPAAVSENRHILADVAGLRPRFVQQVHGTDVLSLNGDIARNSIPVCADAIWTSMPGNVCAMLVADCLPVLFAANDGRQVAAAHAGWRGLAAGVLEQTLRSFEPPAHSGNSHAAIQVIAWLGPCIGPPAFEVGGEVRDAFIRHDHRAAACFQPVPHRAAAEDKWLADLAALARQRLVAAGISRIYGNDSSSEWCTVSNPSRFFSHRRDTPVLGGSGRFAACIWRDV